MSEPPSFGPVIGPLWVFVSTVFGCAALLCVVAGVVVFLAHSLLKGVTVMFLGCLPAAPVLIADGVFSTRYQMPELAPAAVWSAWGLAFAVFGYVLNTVFRDDRRSVVTARRRAT